MKPPPEIREFVPLAPMTTYRIGGAARYYANPTDTQALLRVLRWAGETAASGLPLFVLGGGSNVLISDRGFPGLILHMWGFGGGAAESSPEGIWEVGAGAKLIHWVRRTAAQGFSGAEELIGIPGTIGGGLRMNAGAFSVELGGLLVSLEAIPLAAGKPPERPEIRRILPETIGFGYRSAPGLKDTIILSARLRLTPGDPHRSLEKIREVIAARRSRQPLEMPSCGSVFKRPPNDFAGRLIEKAGLKGMRIGGAQVSPRHANFIVNTGGATAQDVLNLIRLIKRRVREETGVELEREVIAIGFTEDELSGT
jgi:UDP-N-acetylmuramate dehydrogenase